MVCRPAVLEGSPRVAPKAVFLHASLNRVPQAQAFLRRLLLGL